MSAGPQKDVQTSARVRTRGTVVGKQAYLSKRALVATAKAFFSAEISPHTQTRKSTSYESYESYYFAMKTYSGRRTSHGAIYSL